MSTTACAFGGRNHYDNGWAWSSFNSSTNWGHAGFGKDYYGHNRCIVLKITTPSLPNTYINKKLAISIPMCRSSSAGSGTDTFYYRVTTEVPTFSEDGGSSGGVTFPSSYICSGTVDVYNNNQNVSGAYVLRTITTTTANFASKTTYYVWLWSDTPYSYHSNSYKGFYANHTSYGGLISVAVSYTLQEKSTLSVSNGTLGTAQTLTVTRQASSYTHTINYSCGSASGTICTKSSDTSISWTPPLSLSSQNTSGTSVAITFTITTYNGSTNAGSNTYSKVYTIPSSVAPTCTVSVSDSTGYASTYGGYLKGLSKLSVTVKPTLAYNSAIASYRTTANGSTYTSASFTTNVLTSSGSLTVKATVTDKRGRSGSASKSVTVLDYAAPTITLLKVKRCDQDGTENAQGEYVQVTFSANITPLSNQNKAVYTLEYKQTSTTTYTTIDTSAISGSYSVSNTTYIFTADTGSSYDVRLKVTDAFTTATSATSASTASTLIHWPTSGNGISFGKMSEKDNTLETAWDIELNDKTILNNGTPAFAPRDSIVCTDCNTAKTTGFYKLSGSSCKNHPGGLLNYGTMIVVDRYGDYYIEQLATYANQSAMRYYVDNAWSAWEWVNPPMTAGVEYRTVERWQGEVVYTALINCGTTVPGDHIYLTTAIKCSRIIKFTGECSGYALPFINGNSLTGSYTAYAGVYNHSGYISVRVYTGASVQADEALVRVWYTKP